MISSAFASYLQRTRNVCLYRLGGSHLPPLCFPRATTVTLIHCGPEAVNQMLSPSIFPNLRSIHYLSAHPGQVDVYRRFPNATWLFPNQKYLFYNYMVEAGHGMVEHRLIRTYVHRFFPDGNHVELNLPGYGLYLGEWYQSQLQAYLNDPAKHAPSYSVLTSDSPIACTPHSYFDCDASSVSEFIEESMERDFFRSLIDSETKKNRGKRDARHYP